MGRPTLLPGGDCGLDTARRAYEWLETQLVGIAKSPGHDRARERRNHGDAFTVAHRETRT